MRIEVGTVKLCSRVALAASILGGGTLLFNEVDRHDPGALAGGPGLHFLTFFGATLFGFAAFPATRRGDIAKIAVLAAALLQIGRYAAHYHLDLSSALSEAAGAYAVFASSLLERFRAVTRADPHEPFSMVYPNNRRRRSRRTTGQPVRSASLFVVSD